jgi:antirestriction protein ArdC
MEVCMKVNEIITNRIIEELEKGKVPWRQPWTSDGLPKNLVSKKVYRGMNLLLLSFSPYASPYWVTFKQASDLGGSVKQGEKSTIVVFWKALTYDDLDPDSKKLEQTIPFLRYYRIFNTDQCEGLEGKIPQAVARDVTPIQACEEVVQKYTNRPEMVQGSLAAYNPSKDIIKMPPMKDFVSEPFYYATLFHEMVHSTGHKSRLDRCTITDIKPFGSEDHSKEELVAEIGASFLVGYTGIDAEKLFTNTVAYIQSWIKRLKDDPSFILQASSMAQKAYDHILKIEEVE